MSETTNRLEGDVNCLKSELNCSRSEFELSLELNQTLRKLISEHLSLLIVPVSEQKPFSSDDKEGQTTCFKTSYRSSTVKTFSLAINCKGCRREFKAYRCARNRNGHRISEPAYYEHCIKQCDGYKKLGKSFGNLCLSLTFCSFSKKI